MSRKNQPVSAAQRVFTVSIIGLITALVLARLELGAYSVLIGWDVAALLYAASTLMTVLPLKADGTRSHALRESPNQALADIMLTTASIASLVAVGVLMLKAGDATGNTKFLETVLGLVSIILSWTVVHTNYMLRYARLYYGDPEGGVDFNGDQPKYTDFAYLAFTVGMTFQVSDTDVTRQEIRTSILKHALISYIFGAVIIAATINILAGLSK